MRSEITEPEPFEYTILKPAEPIVEPDDEESTIDLEPEQITIEPEDEEETFEETMRECRHSKSPRAQTTARKSKEIKGYDNSY